MKRKLKLSIICLCLILTAGIFMGTFAGATDTLTQPQCIASADAAATEWTPHSLCMFECMHEHCSHAPYGLGWYCEFLCWLRCPLW